MNEFRSVDMNAEEEDIDLPNGNFYLLAIGINKYLHHSNLKTAVNDATKFSELMQTKYGFKKENCTLITNSNATADKIDENIRKFLPEGSNSLTAQDSLLIWFSGHGQDDEYGSRRTYIIPHDGRPNKRVSSWIDYDLVKGYLGNISARQVLLISDSCFSGGALRNINSATLEHTDQYYTNVTVIRGRQALTSGGLEVVRDGGFNGHSVFADALLSFLTNQQKPVLAASELFYHTKKPVSLNAEQTPKFGDLLGAGSHGGEFLFCLSNAEGKEKTDTNTSGVVGIAVSKTVLDEPNKKSSKNKINYKKTKWIFLILLIFMILTGVYFAANGFLRANSSKGISVAEKMILANTLPIDCEGFDDKNCITLHQYTLENNDIEKFKQYTDDLCNRKNIESCSKGAKYFETLTPQNTYLPISLEYYDSLCEINDSVSCYKAGEIFKSGTGENGVVRNFAKAAIRLQEACYASIWNACQSFLSINYISVKYSDKILAINHACEESELKKYCVIGLQLRLSYLRLYDAPIDGILGQRTDNALSELNTLTNTKFGSSLEQTIKEIDALNLNYGIISLIRTFTKHGYLDTSSTVDRSVVDNTIKDLINREIIPPDIYKTPFLNDDGYRPEDKEYLHISSAVRRYHTDLESLDESLKTLATDRYDSNQFRNAFSQAIRSCRNQKHLNSTNSFATKCKQIDQEITELLGLKGGIFEFIKEPRALSVVLKENQTSEPAEFRIVPNISVYDGKPTSNSYVNFELLWSTPNLKQFCSDNRGSLISLSGDVCALPNQKNNLNFISDEMCERTYEIAGIPSLLLPAMNCQVNHSRVSSAYVNGEKTLVGLSLDTKKLKNINLHKVFQVNE